MQTKTSGAQDKFETGARRDARAGKGRYDLLPANVIQRDAGLYERGAIHYGASNWKKGIPSSRYLDSLLRHAFKYLAGLRDEDHLAAVRFNAGGIMYNEDAVAAGTLPPEIHDLAPREVRGRTVPVVHTIAQKSETKRKTKTEAK